MVATRVKLNAMIIVLLTPKSNFTEQDVRAVVGEGPEKLEFHEVSAIPTRRELKVLNPLPELVTEPTPTLDEIAAQPNVPHQGEPQPAPHVTSEPVRVVVIGEDAAVAAVASKLMRIDALWAQLAFVPTGGESAIAHSWGLPEEPGAALEFALTAPPVPTPVIRDDHSIVVLGSAELTGPEGGELFGEVIVDSDTLYHHDRGARGDFTHGVRLVPTPAAPGIAAVQLPSPEQVKRLEKARSGGWWARFTAGFRPPAEPTILKGRALQAGAREMTVTRDTVTHPRPLKAVTFYRHLRDGQFIRR